jgi:hypothetical protein
MTLYTNRGLGMLPPSPDFVYWEWPYEAHVSMYAVTLFTTQEESISCHDRRLRRGYGSIKMIERGRCVQLPEEEREPESHYTAYKQSDRPEQKVLSPVP